MSKADKKGQFQGFKAITVQFSPTSSAQHEMFMKEHTVRNAINDKPLGRTLFLINIPPWATEDSLHKSFSKSALVEAVNFTKISRDDSSSSGFKAGFIIFKSAPDLYKALKLKTLPPLSMPDNPIITGLTKWIKEYNDTVLTQNSRHEHAVATIKNYDAAEEERKRKEKEGEKDDEGWTVVTKKGRNPGVSRKESVHNKIAEKLSRKEKVLKNFYRHQIRQEKRDQLATLRKKAEEDKKKIVALKQRRAFKPF